MIETRITTRWPAAEGPRRGHAMITREIRAAYAARARRGGAFTARPGATRPLHAVVVARWADGGGRHWQVDRSLCGVAPGPWLAPEGTPVTCPRCRAAAYRLEAVAEAGSPPGAPPVITAAAYARYLEAEKARKAGTG